MTRHRALMRRVLAIAVVTVAAAFSMAHNAIAQSEPGSQNTERLVIKFATTADYPPFNARDEDGVLVGFNVD
ncbi:MAG: ABC transporter substrate-binding protein, partial [Pseudomonadota bacterium]